MMRTFHLMAGRTCVVTVSARSLKFLDCDHGKARHDLDGFVIPKNKMIIAVAGFAVDEHQCCYKSAALVDCADHGPEEFDE